MASEYAGEAGEQDPQPTSGGAGSAGGGARSALRPALRLYQRALPERYRLMVWAYRQQRAKTRQQRRFAADATRMTAARQALVETLAETLAAHPERKGVFIFAPSANWSTPLFQRPHQMALALAELGYLVLYCVHLDSTDAVEVCAAVAPNLVLCRVPPQIFHGLPALDEALDDAVVVTYTHTYAWARRTGARRLVYELIDRFEIWPDAPWLMRAAHNQLLRRASVVVGTATDLMAELMPQRPDALLCPNGVDYAHFAPAQTPLVEAAEPAAATVAAGDRTDEDLPDKVPEDLPEEVPEDLRALVASGRPIIGYYGALAAWFDYALWAQVARAMPECHFVLIGPEYDLRLRETAITGVPNIHWLGPKPYAALPRYLRHFSVATIPFVVNDTINAVSPIKLFEYMAGGKPIVTSDLVECRKYPVVLRATTPEEWVAQLREALALGHDASYRAALEATARANTWQARARLLTAALLTRELIERQHPREPSGPQSALQRVSRAPVPSSANRERTARLKR